MIFVLCFLAGVGVGALLAYHFGRVAELKRKAEAWDREHRG
jgi:membrane protein DedA with SNARE-associated domain